MDPVLGIILLTCGIIVVEIVVMTSLLLRCLRTCYTSLTAQLDLLRLLVDAQQRTPMDH